MRTQIDLLLASQRQAELRAAARAIRETSSEQSRTKSQDAPRVFGFRLSLAR